MYKFTTICGGEWEDCEIYKELAILEAQKKSNRASAEPEIDYSKIEALIEVAEKDELGFSQNRTDEETKAQSTSPPPQPNSQRRHPRQNQRNSEKPASPSSGKKNPKAKREHWKKGTQGQTKRNPNDPKKLEDSRANNRKTEATSGNSRKNSRSNGNAAKPQPRNPKLQQKPNKHRPR